MRTQTRLIYFLFRFLAVVSQTIEVLMAF